MSRNDTANSRRSSGWLLSSAVIAVVAAQPAWAQEQSADAGQGGITDIVVTARKQSESLQEVQMCISSFWVIVLDRVVF